MIMNELYLVQNCTSHTLNSNLSLPGYFLEGPHNFEMRRGTKKGVLLGRGSVTRSELVESRFLVLGYRVIIVGLRVVVVGVY